MINCCFISVNLNNKKLFKSKNIKEFLLIPTIINNGINVDAQNLEFYTRSLNTAFRFFYELGYNLYFKDSFSEKKNILKYNYNSFLEIRTRHGISISGVNLIATFKILIYD